MSTIFVLWRWNGTRVFLLIRVDSFPSKSVNPVKAKVFECAQTYKKVAKPHISRRKVDLKNNNCNKNLQKDKKLGIPIFTTGGPSSRLEKKPTINSWKSYALCDSVLSYERNRWKFEFSTESTNYPQFDIFLYSHHLSGWYCIDTVGSSWVGHS